jgi:ATP-dependent exoDNAse (exonuclease V) beta subunit
MDDAAARRAALDVRVSCIVRAPAGSGKTELLTQRYLALLATVDEPEEIIAITFTRKAAGEMRDRIVEALELARGAEPEAPHKRVTWELGRRAQARDAERGWQLRLHPARMRIQTIDSLDAELTRQMPLLSGFGAPLRVNERPQELYEEAARRTLRLLDEGEPLQAAAVESLARHLDCDLPRIHRLLSRMLARRDQWLRHMQSPREELEAALRREVDGHLQQLQAALPADCRQELLELATHAGSVLRTGGVESDLTACAALMELPPADATGLAAWRGIATLLLTDAGQWRRVLNKNQGFPPEEAGAKARAVELIRRLEREAALCAALAAVPYLPEPRYADAQWLVLEALLQILPLATAQLRLVFAERGEADFAEVTLGALQALGEPEAPTDLALALDYRIRHLLVDEFQDTSVNQFRLLTVLTAGWQPEDGRTLFLVGDPAQSIYRFREAEVGLFLSAWQQGLGGLPLKPLQLQANFRSRAELVDWYNQVFPSLFPASADVASGGVPYGVSQARREVAGCAAVTVHALGEDRRAQEAEKILEIARGAEAGARVAVLTRAKSHLAAVVAALRRCGMHFQAVEIETLGRQPVVQDLLALTRALAHPADRSAWLAVLRAPWCALTLTELHALAGADHDATLPALMAVADGLAASNPRFAHTRTVLLRALTERSRGTLREQVEHAWLALGGPAALAGEEALADAEAYLALLEEIGEGGALMSAGELERRLAQLFARPDPEADGSLQLMTIHKAKGLEFEVVILPGLDAAVRGEDLDLMVWLERPRADGAADLLLAPLDAPGQERDALYTWVRMLRQEQEQLEQVRVLYVAATRARERLHLLGGVDMKEEEGRPVPAAPRTGSLLALLWPAVRVEFEKGTASPTTPTPPPRPAEAPAFTRLAAAWQPPAPEPGIAWSGSTVLAAEQDLEFQWVGETLRHVGTVVHRLLQRIAEDGLERWDAAQRQRALPLVRQLLSQAGVREEELAGAAADTMRAVDNMLADERGRWLLDNNHADARCEYALSLLRDGRLETGVIDRSFVDADGTRWIVDYKTSRHSGTDVDAFLEHERVRYAPQLERYARLVRGLGTPRVKVALYFPLMQRFLSWEPDHGPEP